MTRKEMMIRADIQAYDNSTDYSIFHAYKNPSPRKVGAFEHCIEIMHRYGGRALKVVRHNCFVFSAAFLFDDPDTGEIKFAYITPSKLTICDY